jgi:hypothetical protein
MISLASAASGKNSQAGGGFDFNDDELGTKITKSLKK